MLEMWELVTVCQAECGVTGVDVDVRHNTWKVSRPAQAPPASHLGLGDHMPGKL